VILDITALFAMLIILKIINNVNKSYFQNSIVGVFKAVELYEAKSYFDEINK